MNLEKFNTKTQSHEDTKIEDIVGSKLGLELRQAAALQKIFKTCRYFTVSFICLLFSQIYSSPDISSLTLEEKIGQMLMVHFTGLEANEESLEAISQAYVGGIIYYNWANGLTSPSQIRILSQGLQQQAKTTRLAIPLFIAVDQEGGRVTRLTNGFTSIPSNYALGLTNNPQIAFDYAYIVGQELSAVGINVNLAPVLDINDNPFNPVIGVRSYGMTPKIVSTFGAKAIEGYHAAGIISAIKHFPGHGSTENDSHFELPVVKKSREELELNELVPFRQLANQADMVMTAHLLIPALDPLHCATLSKILIEDILRGAIGFKGVVMSDSLVMKGLLNECHSPEEAAILSIEAGCDLLILGGRFLIEKHSYELVIDNIMRIHRALCHEVRTGRISQERIDCSVKRILDLKEKYGFFKNYIHRE